MARAEYIRRMRRPVVVLAALLLSSSPALRSQERNPFAGAMASLSRAEIARVLRAGCEWNCYRADGTSRGDTTRQLAAMGGQDLEGSEPRGLVLFRLGPWVSSSLDCTRRHMAGDRYACQPENWRACDQVTSPA